MTYRNSKIEFAPAAELFDTGNEPFQILKALRDLGECEIECVTDKLVSLEQLSAETPYLYWKVTLSANVDPAEVASVFEFVDGLCTLKIEALSVSEGAAELETDATLEDLPPPLPTVADEPIVQAEKV